VVFEVADNKLIVQVNDNGKEHELARAKKTRGNPESPADASEILERRLELFNRRTATPIEIKHQNNHLANTRFVNEVTLIIPRPLFG